MKCHQKIFIYTKTRTRRLNNNGKMSATSKVIMASNSFSSVEFTSLKTRLEFQETSLVIPRK